MAPVMAMPQSTPRRSASRILLAATAGAAALAGKFFSGAAGGSAFVGGTGLAVNRAYEGRTVEVFRQIRNGVMPSPVKARIYEELLTMSTDDLKNVVALSRKYNFEHRLNAFRKQKPDRQPLYEMHYKLVAAKQIMREREIEAATKAAEEAGPEEPETYAEFSARTWDWEQARRTWSYRPGIRRMNQKPCPRNAGDGMRQRLVPYYKKKDFVEGSGKDMDVAPWEEGVRTTFKQAKINRAKKLQNTKSFRVPNAMPNMMPKSKQ